MTTLKIKYTSSPEFQELLLSMRKEQSSVIRSAFNRFQEGKKQGEIRETIKEMENITLLDSWWIQSAVVDAETMFSSIGARRIVFGGKGMLKRFMKGLISKEGWKSSRLLPLVSCGEASQAGNRKFRLDILNGNINFQDKHGRNKHTLKFQPQLRDRLEQLLFIEEKAKSKSQPLTIKITDTHIHLTFKEKQKEVVPVIENRIMAIDTNPNSIGWSVCDIKGGAPAVIDSGIIELKTLNQKKTNKKHFETFEICKFLANKAVHYSCSSFAVEDLHIAPKEHNKGKTFNKTVNNDWIRSKLFSNLKKRCFINNIKFIEVNPAYTSVIGGIIHRDYPDPIAPALEIARRAFFKYQKGKFYPPVPGADILNELWKQTSEKSLKSWKEVADWLKNIKYRYRVPVEDFSTTVLRFRSIRSIITCRNLNI